MHEFTPIDHIAPGSDGALQTVERAFSVLHVLTDGPHTGSALARRLGLKWATAHRMLTTLTTLGYVERDENGEYRLGLRAYALGSAYVLSSRLHQAARPYLRAASLSAQVVAQIAERGGRSSIVLSVHEPKVDYVPETSVGCNFPLHCGSKGHVLLAWADPAFVDDYLSGPLEALTPYTCTDPDVLRATLDRVRRDGYAVTDRDVRLFSSSVAAPVFGPQDQLLGALTLVCRPERFQVLRRRLIRLVTSTAEGISRAVRARYPHTQDGLMAPLSVLTRAGSAT